MLSSNNLDLRRVLHPSTFRGWVQGLGSGVGFRGWVQGLGSKHAPHPD